MISLYISLAAIIIMTGAFVFAAREWVIRRTIVPSAPAINIAVPEGKLSREQVALVVFGALLSKLQMPGSERHTARRAIKIADEFLAALAEERQALVEQPPPDASKSAVV